MKSIPDWVTQTEEGIKEQLKYSGATEAEIQQLIDDCNKAAEHDYNSGTFAVRAIGVSRCQRFQVHGDLWC